MAKIKIKDLPEDAKISEEELRKIRGGLTLAYTKPTVLRTDPRLLSVQWTGSPFAEDISCW